MDIGLFTTENSIANSGGVEYFTQRELIAIPFMR